MEIIGPPKELSLSFILHPPFPQSWGRIVIDVVIWLSFNEIGLLVFGQFHKDNLRHLSRFPDFFLTFRILSNTRFLFFYFGDMAVFGPQNKEWPIYSSPINKRGS